jgi:hypothetical protein
MPSAPEIGQYHFDHSDDLRIAQVSGKEKRKGKEFDGFAASKKGQHREQEEGKEDQEKGKWKGKGLGGVAASKKGQHRGQEEENEDQEKGKGLGGLAASRKGQLSEQENAASGEEDESAGGGGRRCPAGESVAPLRGRGGSASQRGAGCM